MLRPDDVLELLAEVVEAASSAGRPDLAERVTARRERLVAPDVCVVVAGEFKAGKSSLVNALVGAEVCPVDDDVATSVPTFVRFAPEAGVRARRGADDDQPVDLEPVDRVAAYATERGNPENRAGVRAVEVGIPSAVLRDGLVLVDTPGVGGLRSAYASATMTTLAMAHAVIFVSDASQEYTRPELDFLAAAGRACPEIVAVLSKVDLVPDWRRIHELNEGWLAQAGVAGALVATSAALALQGHRQDRADLREESGMTSVLARLGGIAHRFRQALGAVALDEAAALVGQLAAPLRAEHDALTDPAATIGPLRQAVERAQALTTDADWSALLDDGMIDLEATLDRDLARRMKAVLNEVEQTVRASDPAVNWTELEAELCRQVSNEISAVAVGLAEGANDLAARLAQEFAEHEQAIAPALSVAPDLAAIADGSVVLGARATPWRGVLVDAGWGGLEALGVLGSILTFTSINLFNPFALVIGVFIGGKSLRDSRRRELERRRDQALVAVTQYVQDAVQSADRELKATARRIRRELRTTYQRRADALLRSARDSLGAAERTIGADPFSREARRKELTARIEDLTGLAGRVEALARQ